MTRAKSASRTQNMRHRQSVTMDTRNTSSNSGGSGSSGGGGDSKEGGSQKHVRDKGSGEAGRTGIETFISQSTSHTTSSSTTTSSASIRDRDISPSYPPVPFPELYFGGCCWGAAFYIGEDPRPPAVMMFCPALPCSDISFHLSPTF